MSPTRPIVPPRKWLRRAGRGTLPDGATLVWSVAEGSRGRRWRAAATLDGRLTHALLLETSPGGRLQRLELTTSSGLLTLHPEPDGRSIHGNVVHIGGVRPCAFPWSQEHDIEVIDRPLASAAMLRRLARTVEVGGGETVAVLSVDAALTVRPGTLLVRRIASERWIVADVAGNRETTIELDPDGIPVLGAANDWQLDA